MEYVDGSSFEQIVEKCGPMDVSRVAHYLRQAALGLQHIYERGVVHRDIKPSDILVDRSGTVKIIDMGLARIISDGTDLPTGRYCGDLLGTPDYMAPEQAVEPCSVDIRADLYSLGATFYFCLVGSPPFPEGTIAQKVLWHRKREPQPIQRLRPEVPMSKRLAALIEQMMAKDVAQRPQAPQEVADALAPYTKEFIGPPPEAEMPIMCTAVRAIPAW
jgi:serine/threonine protein kinase